MSNDTRASHPVPQRRRAFLRATVGSRLRTRCVRVVSAASLGVTLAAVGCATTPVPVTGDAALAGRDPDRLLVVDCLLPGQLRRLGRSITFMTPRRPTRVNASECEIRGGEYVAYDRASFATSLQVWLPRAQEGDAEAQTLVGEIFEKGLGQIADPAIAAEWYRRAADQGSSRALINLGYLHESGLGVERDLPRAMNLYRRAAGFEDGSLEYVTSVELAEREQRAAELPGLRERAARADRELLVERRAFARLQDDYRELELEAERVRGRVAESASRSTPLPGTGEAASDGAVDGAVDGAANGAEEARIGALIVELDGLRARLAAADGDDERLVGALEAQQRETGELRRAVSSASSELRRTRGELDERDARIERLETLLAERDASEADADAAGAADARAADARTGALRTELAETTVARDELDARVRRLETEAAARDGDLDARLEVAEAKEASLLTELERSRDALRDSRAALADKDAAYRERIGALGRTEGSLRAELDGRRRNAVELEARIASLQDAVDDAATSARDADAARATIDALRTELATARAGLAGARASASEDEARSLERLAELEAELERRGTEVENRRESIGALEATVSRARADDDGPAIEQVSEIVATGPVIEIIDPPVSVRGDGFAIALSAGSRSVDVVGRASSDTELVSFRIDGGPGELNRHGIFKHPVTLDRSSTLSLAAVDDAGNRTAMEFELLPDAGGEGGGTRSLSVDVSGLNFGRYHALVIGNADYVAMPDVETSGEDATAIARVLEQRYGFSTELLLDADRYDMLAALNRKRDELAGDDNLLVFYAGRSQSGGGQGYWLPVDADPTDRTTWVSNVALTGLIDSMDAKHVMIVADAVFPATLSGSSIPRLGDAMDADQRLRLYELASSSKVRTVLVSGGSAPVASASDLDGRSVFGASVLDALEGADGDVVMAHDLFVGIRERMSREDESSASLGTPSYSPMRYAGHENGEFLFVPTERRVGALILPPGQVPTRAPTRAPTRTPTRVPASTLAASSDATTS